MLNYYEIFYVLQAIICTAVTPTMATNMVFGAERISSIRLHNLSNDSIRSRQ